MFNHLEPIATTLRFSISVSFSPQPSSASNPSHKVRSSDSQRESEQHHFRLAPHGSSKVVWQFLAGSERSGALRLLSPQRQRFLRPGRFRFISNINLPLNFSAFGVNSGLVFLLSTTSIFSISPLCFNFTNINSSLILVLVQRLFKG